MLITKNITLDLSVRGFPEIIDAVQNDNHTRAVKISLADNGVPWEPPDHARASVAFIKSDMTSGWYDMLPTGDDACLIDGSTVTAYLAPEVLTAPGRVRVLVVFIDENLSRLATFPFVVNVAEDPAAGKVISNSYYNLQTLGEINDAIDGINEALAGIDSALAGVAKIDDAAVGAQAWSSKNTVDKLAIMPEASGVVISISDASNLPIQGLKLYGKTTQDGTPTPDHPVPLVSVGNGGTVGVHVYGKNLLNISERTIKKITYIQEENNVVSDAHWGVELILAPGTYTLKATAIVTVENRFLYGYVSDLDKTRWITNMHPVPGQPQDAKTVTFTEWVRLSIVDRSASIANGRTKDHTIAVFNEFNIQLEVGNTATVFERCIEQTFTASTPNGLPGIPVASGGNYTDAIGQQWVCDEIDFARGVYVQRVYRKAFDGTETIRTSNDGLFIVNGKMPNAKRNNLIADRYVYCTDYGLNICQMRNNHAEWYIGHTVSGFADPVAYKAYLAEQFANGTPVMIAYELLTPIETPLSSEELAQFAALHSNKPKTTVCNDEGAYMELAYNADTKTYIDNKFAELQNAILATGANV